MPGWVREKGRSRGAAPRDAERLKERRRRRRTVSTGARGKQVR
jgi:hypothetical protein